MRKQRRETDREERYGCWKVVGLSDRYIRDLDSIKHQYQHFEITSQYTCLQLTDTLTLVSNLALSNFSKYTENGILCKLALKEKLNPELCFVKSLSQSLSICSWLAFITNHENPLSKGGIIISKTIKVY